MPIILKPLKTFAMMSSFIFIFTLKTFRTKNKNTLLNVYCILVELFIRHTKHQYIHNIFPTH